MKLLALTAFLAAAGTAFANDYPAGFNHQPQHSPAYSAPTNHRSYRYSPPPRKERTTVRRLPSGDVVIEKKRYHGHSTGSFRSTDQVGR